LINLLLVNLWEETAWAGVVQTRLAQRHNVVVAGLLTAVPFGLVHWPLAFIGDFTLTSVLVALPAYVVLGALVRPLGGLVMRGAGGSVLAFALLHSVFNRSNNPNGIVAAVLDGSAYQIGILIVLVLLPVIVARLQRGLMAFVRRHPHASFLIVFNTLGQAAAFAPVIAHRVYGADWNIELYLIFPTLVFLLLPALVITRITRGADGLRELARSMVQFRFNAAWHLLPLVAVPALTLLTALPAPPGITVAEAATAYLTVFLPALAVQFLTTNLWEETVWTGFFQAPLQDRFGPWRAVLLTTPFFALEHISLVAGAGPAQFGLILVVAFVTRVLLGWIYRRTGSVALAGLVHAAANAAGIALVPRLFHQPGGGGTALLLLGLVVILATLAASAVVTTRKGLRHA
jgi:membrane protease YdiL (CAAX protease family)